MEEGPYQLGKLYKGVLERKGMMWSKIWISMKSITMGIAEGEGKENSQIIRITNVIPSADFGGEALGFLISTSEKETITMRATDEADYTRWARLFKNALQAVGLGEVELPPTDPRTGLPFIRVPREYVSRFMYLSRAVMFFFSPVKKYGAKGGLLGRQKVEDRIAVLGDKYFYVCKPDSDVTRCLRVTHMTHLFTNAGNPGKEEPFLVIKMRAPEYDMHLSCPTVKDLCQMLCALHNHHSGGQSNLEAIEVPSAQDPKVDLNLVRPEGWSMDLVLPSTRKQLKKALDVFAHKHGIKFVESAAGTGTVVKQQTEEEQEVVEAGGAPPTTNALGVFLTKLGMPDYFASLNKQSVDLDVLEFMDATDLANFGVSKPEDVKTILSKLQDEAFIQGVKREAHANKSGKKAPATGGAAPAASAAASAQKPAINLDDDDDDLDVVVAGAGGAGAGGIDLDDFDDDLDLDLPPPKTDVNLDSDDDLDVPMPAPKQAGGQQPVIDLSDDDDL